MSHVQYALTEGKQISLETILAEVAMTTASIEVSLNEM